MISLIFNSVICGMRTESANETSVTEILENAAGEEYLLPYLIVNMIVTALIIVFTILLILYRYISLCILMSDY